MKKHVRQAMSAGLAALLIAAVPMTASAAQASDFTDARPGAWYYGAVDYATQNGLFSGTGENTFSPEQGMTRGMFVTVLGRRSGVDSAKPSSTSFTDVETKDYYAPYVEWAAEHEIVGGTGEGRFSPNALITREQMASILYRYAQQTGNDTSVDPAVFAAFPDKTSVSRYAEFAMKWATSHGVINGSDGKLNPQGTATRAQVAQVFLNAEEAIPKTKVAEPFTPGDSPELTAIRNYLKEKLPPETQWTEEAVGGGWVGPLVTDDGGKWHGVQYYGAEYVATYCVFMLTEIDGFTYHQHYVEERPDGFYLHYA